MGGMKRNRSRMGEKRNTQANRDCYRNIKLESDYIDVQLGCIQFRMLFKISSSEKFANADVLNSVNINYYHYHYRYISPTVNCYSMHLRCGDSRMRCARVYLATPCVWYYIIKCIQLQACVRTRCVFLY